MGPWWRRRKSLRQIQSRMLHLHLRSEDLLASGLVGYSELEFTEKTHLVMCRGIRRQCRA